MVVFVVSNQALSSQALDWFFSHSFAVSDVFPGAEMVESSPEDPRKQRFLHVTREYGDSREDSKAQKL